MEKRFFEKLSTKIYNDNFDHLLNYFKKKTLQYDDACECTHITLTKGILNIEKLNSLDEQVIKNWLFHIANNVFLNFVKKTKKTVITDKFIDTSTNEDVNIKDFLTAYLPEKEVNLSNLYFEGYSLDELSVIYNTDKKSIKNKIYKIRKKLKTSIIHEF